MELNGISWLMVGTMLLAGVVLGFLAGRRSSAVRARAQQLESDLEELRKQHEHAQAEIETGRATLARAEDEIETGRENLARAQAEIETGRENLARAEAEIEAGREKHDRYRGKVADHFAGTSERLRDLTLQYREVYNHLAEGAGELCPEGFEKLEGGLGLDALPEESETPESDPN